MKKADFLRKRYPRFIYKGYSYKIVGDNLKIVFSFRIEPNIRLKPEIIIKHIQPSRLKKIGERAMNNLVFHLGLIEIPSYWKTTCSPEIVIRAGYLDEKQIKWWQDLIVKGMGQFFYENKIDYRKSDFLKIISNPKIEVRPLGSALFKLKNRYLVPVREGKDSIVTLEELKKQKVSINTFTVNSTKAAKNVLRTAGIRSPILIERKIDPILLKLNKKGYLNGHTPFTAVLSFLSVFCAVLFDYKHIAFSNEKSADEGNIKYLGKIVNHQYSKSSEFEKRFQDYCQQYLAVNVNYFSFLRKYTEIEIAKIFARYPKYFPLFLSCNEAYKTDSGQKRPKLKWCGQCSKCLFVYTILYPYLNKEQLLKIFGKDLFEEKKLLITMKALIGQGRAKPFECVGTYKESQLAFKLSLKKAKKAGKIPYLLKQFNAFK